MASVPQWLEKATPTSFLGFLLFSLSSILLFLSLTRSKREKGTTAEAKLPPGPPKLPLIGNLHQLSKLAHRSLRDLALKYGPLMFLQLGQVPTLVVSSPAMAKAVMKTHDLSFASRPHLTSTKNLLYNSSDIAFSPYGSYWRNMRKICILELLSIKRVESFRFVREEEVVRLMETIETSKGTVNLSHLFLSLTNNITGRIAFGRSYDKFYVLLNELQILLGGFSLGDLFPSMDWIDVLTGIQARQKKNFRELNAFIDLVIEDHLHPRTRASNPEFKDFVDVLLEVQKQAELDFPFTRDNLKAVILDMFGAGTETTATVLEWTMTELMKNPNVMKKAQDEVRKIANGRQTIGENDLPELEYLKLVMKESMRLHAPVPLLLPRESLEKCSINGYEIPKGTKVIINAWAISRHAETWASPEEFRPERFIESSIDYKGQDFEFIPFGAGRRGCPGIAFGVASLELALANLLLHFDWELPHGMSPNDMDMAEIFGLTMHRKIVY
ncbi:hypothetical protein AMTR_s00174p00028950 [Amborella trichopoda]|uniref:Cytochrome P450 n=1 Tax=Amborella trichopoda TaxID=13333 RepID=U5CWF9_AMBTC|nr:hypothetical protein AMTR_s00174p00028950 [Amborella trichopoda]